MSLKQLWAKEKYVAIHGQSLRFRLIKYAILVPATIALLVWQGWYITLQVYGVLFILAIAMHLFYRYMTGSWQRSWGGYKYIPLEHVDLKESWKKHPLYEQGLIEMVPIEWVWHYWGRDVSPEADLMDGTRVSMDELWSNIEKEGMHNPLIMRVGIKNKMFRLEAGNHRIQLLHKHGIQRVPLTVQLREECGPHVEDVMNDASHNFEAGDELRVDSITQEYMRPSDVFKSLAR